ncbi:MAG: Lpxtg-site transpeptidase (Sortase) family protein [Microgenomates group bacterium GW2011_GWA2_40_6]|nr:MAG: Lpxtg-site transpeptidase (Sortase) family protein [Microgenomates group bacterium GW2011_GWA2_40_6]
MGYIYLKKSPSINRRSRKPRRILSAVFLSLGVFLFLSAVVPIVQFQFEYSLKFNQILSPLSSRFSNPGSVLGDTNTDFTQLSNWFEKGSAAPSDNPNFLSLDNRISSYSLSVPKLKIEKALVLIGSSDLKSSLIHYPQTALPGQLGSSVIFGHSVLPQFFNPKSYLTIFSTLYKLKQGDEIFVDFDNIKYRYLVEEMYEVAPTDLSVLEQHFDGRYLTLITCSPPGTYLRRLIIKARIVEI